MEITIKYDSKEYKLEYTRKSVTAMEKQGFLVDEMGSKPMTMIPLLEYGAFMQNHPTLKREVIDEIFKNINNRSALIEELMKMYAETIVTLMGDGENEGNATWEVQH